MQDDDEELADNEEADDEEEDFSGTEFRPDEYYQQLQPIVYESAEAAKRVTFKDFISVNIRKHLPAVYRGLISDWNALSLWKDGKYFTDKIGEEYVEAISYLREEPFPNYAGEGVAPNQRASYVPFNMFYDSYLEKFDDKELKDPQDAVNMIYR